MTGSVSRTWDVLCLGIPVIEFVETAAGTYERMPGGDSARVALAVARSGGSAAVAGRLGADGFGSEFQEMCRREGLADAGLSIDPTAPTAQGFRHLEDHDPDTTAALLAGEDPDSIKQQLSGVDRFLDGLRN